MITKDKLKEIILSNQEFILKQVGTIIKREDIHLPTKLRKVVIFYGVRRSGKTFILYDLFRDFKDEALYIDFEDERLTDFTTGDFEVLKEAFLELNPHLINKRKVFLFDEVQNITGWEKFCRRVVERENTRVFVAGSSSKIMPLEIHTALRGRAWSIEVTPFSFREYLRTKNIVFRKAQIYSSKKILFKNHFYDYMKWGGFPEVVFSRDEFEKNKILKEYLGSIFFKDLVERFEINNISLLEALTEGLFSSFSLKFSLTAFYKQYKNIFPFSKDSLFNYYRYFLQSMLVLDVKKFTESSYKRIRNPAKIYLIDTSLAKKISSQDSGRLLENIVFVELWRRFDKIFYFEEEKECDFVVQKDGRFSAYQVCYNLSDENRERELTGLILCGKRLRLKSGIILTLDQEDELRKETMRIKIIPVWKWLLI